MNTQTNAKVIWRICWRVALFALVGAVSVGPIAVFVLFVSVTFVDPSRLNFAVLGLLYGAFCLGLSGWLTAKRRDCNETLHMAIGGALLGMVNCFFLGAVTFCIAVFFLKLKIIVGIFSSFILMGALLGSLYTSLHPKYIPREEPLLLFEPREIEYSNDNTEH